MKILLVNDDGIDSEGLQILRKVLSDHDVWVSAPNAERSGSSHAITLSEAVRTRRQDKKTLIVRGTPADCVLIGLQYLLDEPQDVIVSGINLGANTGADIIFSGTAAAARQAVILGIPGVAVSLNTFVPPYRLSSAAEFIGANLEDLVELWRKSTDKAYFLNINVPNVERFEGDVVIAAPGRLTYENSLTTFDTPRGEVYHFYNDTGRIGLDDDKVTDIDLLRAGNIVVSPVKVYPDISPVADLYRSHSFTVGKESR